MTLKILIFVCKRRASFMEPSIAIIATNTTGSITISFPHSLHFQSSFSEESSDVELDVSSSLSVLLHNSCNLGGGLTLRTGRYGAVTLVTFVTMFAAATSLFSSVRSDSKDFADWRHCFPPRVLIPLPLS